MSRIDTLRLSDFRSYAEADLATAGASVFLFGPNGAGKTNLLEAASLLAPGRGLRNASLAEIGRREPGAAEGRPWAVFAKLQTAEGEVDIGAGAESPAASRRTVRIQGAAAPVARLAEFARPIWLTPAHDRLFAEPASERRRFFDRLVFAANPAHGADAAVYEQALRERGRVLADGGGDPGWLTALEARMAASGARLALARAHTAAALTDEIDRRGEGPFPRAAIRLTGDWEALAAEGLGEEEIAARLAQALAASRARDAEAGRSLTGPHRTDLEVRHAALGRPARECSSGEQKALVLNLVLAQAARLAREIGAPNPILLLDEVAAHLDSSRRAALFDEIWSLSLQAFLTGTDETLFQALEGRALGVHVETSRLTPIV
ncbi:MAG TPA: DNA replication/repair protein RecF [Caulobacteraceae bacterium]|nr:DNA replication/repair protein RecF [Caulobacteraceae bacterium]